MKTRHAERGARGSMQGGEAWQDSWQLQGGLSAVIQASEH